MNDNTAHFVTTIGSALSEDGEAAQLQFHRASGGVANVDFPTASMGDLLMAITAAMDRLVERQRKSGRGPKKFFDLEAKRAAKIRGVISEGSPMLSVTLSSGVVLTFTVALADLQLLRALLETIESTVEQARGQPN